MRSTTTLFLLFCSALFFAQNNSKKNELIFEDLKLEITIDSYNDTKDINLNDIKSIFKQSKINQPIEFKVHCNNITSIESSIITNLSFSVNGNSNEIDSFMKKIKTIKKSMKKYYHNQKSNKWKTQLH